MIAQAIELARAHAPLLTIGAPLIGAAAAAITPQARLSWLVAMIAAAAAAFIASDLAARHLLTGIARPMAHEGVALWVDGVGPFSVAIVAWATLLALLAGGALEAGQRTAPYACALALCVSAGWSGALLAGDFIALFIAAEIGWLAAVGLVALSGDAERGALNGALRMLSAGAFAAALTLLGVALIGRAVGSVEIGAIAAAPVAAPRLAITGVTLVLVGMAVKAGVAPLHFWSGATFGRGGGFALLVVGVVAAVGALMALARVASLAMSAPFVGASISAVLVALGAASAIIGSVQAVGAVNMRRLAAYAGVSQVGCILLSIALGSPAGLAAALVQTFALAAAMLALLGGFAAARDPALTSLDGFARRDPIASIAITAGALSLMGAPLTVGFLGRWRLIEASVGAGWWWAAGAALVSSLAAVFYGGRLIERMFFRRATSTADTDRSLWRAAMAPTLVAAILAIALGFEPSLLLRAAASAALLQFGQAP